MRGRDEPSAAVHLGDGEVGAAGVVAVAHHHNRAVPTFALTGHSYDRGCSRAFRRSVHDLIATINSNKLATEVIDRLGVLSKCV